MRLCHLLRTIWLPRVRLWLCSGLALPTLLVMLLGQSSDVRGVALKDSGRHFQTWIVWVWSMFRKPAATPVAWRSLSYGTESQWRNKTRPCCCLHAQGFLGQGGLYLTLKRSQEGLNFLSSLLKHINRIGKKLKNWKQFHSLESFAWLRLIKFIIASTFSCLIFYHKCGLRLLH